MTDKKKWVRFALYAAELLLLFSLQEIPGLLPKIMGAKPLFVLGAVLTMSMREEAVPAMGLGIFAGLLTDLGMGSPMGWHALVYGVLCLSLCMLCGTRMQIHLYTSILMGLWSIAVAVLLDWLVLYIASGYGWPVYALVNAYLPLYFYTVLTVPVCCGLQYLVQRFFGRLGA